MSHLFVFETDFPYAVHTVFWTHSSASLCSAQITVLCPHGQLGFLILLWVSTWASFQSWKDWMYSSSGCLYKTHPGLPASILLWVGRPKTNTLCGRACFRLAGLVLGRARSVGPPALVKPCVCWVLSWSKSVLAILLATLLVFVATVTGGKRRKDFAQTTSACLSFIQEALLKHQWQQAAEYMHSYLQTLEDSDTYKRQAAPEVHKCRSVGQSSCLNFLRMRIIPPSLA